LHQETPLHDARPRDAHVLREVDRSLPLNDFSGIYMDDITRDLITRTRTCTHGSVTESRSMNAFR